MTSDNGPDLSGLSSITNMFKNFSFSNIGSSIGKIGDSINNFAKSELTQIPFVGGLLANNLEPIEVGAAAGAIDKLEGAGTGTTAIGALVAGVMKKFGISTGWDLAAGAGIGLLGKMLFGGDAPAPAKTEKAKSEDQDSGSQWSFLGEMVMGALLVGTAFAVYEHLFGNKASPGNNPAPAMG